MNPLSMSEPWSLVSEGYAETTMPMLRMYAKEAVRLLEPEQNAHVLDLACGPGTLSVFLSRDVEKITAVDFSSRMLACLKINIEKENLQNIEHYEMDGQNLSFPPDRFDAAFSMFGLMFFPDRLKGFQELYRVLKPGKKAAVSSWAPMENSPMMSLMFGAIAAALPEMAEKNDGQLKGLDDREVFFNEMEAAGFKNVEIHSFAPEMEIKNVDEFFKNMVRGGAPIQLMIKKLGPEKWEEKSRVMLEYLRANLQELPVKLTSQAYIGIGEKSGEG